MSEKQITNDPFLSVRIPEYKHLMAGRFLYIAALRMMGTLTGWWIYNLTNDPFAIGLIGLSEVIPAVSLALYAGHVVDQSEKRKLMLTGICLYLCCALLLLFLSTQYTSNHLTDHAIALCIYAVIFCTGIVRAFTGSIFAVIMTYIVPKNMLQNASTWNSATFLTASVVGHATGGFLIALTGNTGTLVTICTLIIIAFLVLLYIKPKPAIDTGAEKKTWESVKEGLRFVFKTKELLGAITLDLFAVLFGGAVTMVPVFARDILKVGATGFGWLNAAMDTGAIISIVTLIIFPMKKQQGRKLFFAVAGFGICIIVFAFSRSFLLSFFTLVICGMLDGISVVVRGTVLQLKTPDNMRGRVLSVNSIFISSSNEFGQFESGFAARIFGNVPSVIFGGCMTLLVVIITWFKAPSLRKMEY